MAGEYYLQSINNPIITIYVKTFITVAFFVRKISVRNLLNTNCKGNINKVIMKKVKMK